MKKIEVSVGTNRVGSMVKRIIEVDDESTEEEISEIAWEEVMEMINYGWKEMK